MSAEAARNWAERIAASRKPLAAGAPVPRAAAAQEGGCGVVGFASSVPVRGRHIFEPSVQMHNRGNGKGGGIAAAGLAPEQLGVDAATLRECYLLQVALLDPRAEKRVEEEFILPHLDVRHSRRLAPAADPREFGLEVRPPDVAQYFVRAREEALSRFAERDGLQDAPRREVEDEFICQNSVRLNQALYAPMGEKQAFVLSHARDLVIFKIVGYAEQVVQYYGLQDFRARVWIAHQRYPTKGRVWHPAGSHPFIGMNEALVHNGDFANYHGIAGYLRQHHIAPQFLTDTEVAVQLFDLWSRTFRYPTEYVIEAMAPTTELDFERLPEEKKKVYRALQRLHLHAAPDGPWFFIIARSDPDRDRYELLGITDTSMLRPQVFAFQQGEVSIGLVASEKQAVDATLRSLSEEDPRFRPVADRVWNARGGSHTDGGAFVFSVHAEGPGGTVTCADKFGKPVALPPNPPASKTDGGPAAPPEGPDIVREIERGGPAAFGRIAGAIPSWNAGHLRWLTGEIGGIARRAPDRVEEALALLALLNDRRFDTGALRRRVVLEIVQRGVDAVLDAVPPIDGAGAGPARRIDWVTRKDLRPPAGEETLLVILARDFPPEGDECDSGLAARAWKLGWKRFVVYGLRGQRFTGCGFGPATDGVRIDVFGSSGDYLASGIDGMEIVVHGNAQDQLGQIMKRGRLVVHGDVGQTFMYGAKGGEVFILGNAAGRPLINAAGRPRVVINGTCLDFLAESFMAGDPLKGGGFVILNGVEFDGAGRVREQETPYPGSNLFSLASGGAIYVRDPRRRLVRDQLNGGEFAPLGDPDWEVIRPYLETNERLFGISIERDLLTVDGVRRPPGEVYRKVRAVRLAALAKEGVAE